jgi:hypothetical protein
MLGTIIKSIPGAAVAFIQAGVPQLLSGVSGIIESIATGAKGLADSISAEKVTSWAQTMIPKILSSAANLLGTFAKGLVANLPKIVVAIGKIGLAIVKGLGSALWSKITAAANGIKERFLKPIETLREKVRGIIDKIKGFFKFKVSAPHVPLPHFSISPAGWRLSDLLKGVKPSLGISWYAKGGIFDEPTIAGIGEAGPEAVVPLNKFWDKLDQMGGNTFNVTLNANGAENPEQYAQRFARELRRQVRMGAI